MDLSHLRAYLSELFRKPNFTPSSSSVLYSQVSLTLWAFPNTFNNLSFSTVSLKLFLPSCGYLWTMGVTSIPAYMLWLFWSHFHFPLGSIQRLTACLPCSFSFKPSWNYLCGSIWIHLLNSFTNETKNPKRGPWLSLYHVDLNELLHS